MGGESHGRGERAIEHGCELARYPFRRETSPGFPPIYDQLQRLWGCGVLAAKPRNPGQADGVAHAKSGDEYLCIQTCELYLLAVESEYT
jgi:hypothetical protein